jgi:deoxyribose-phosphate aldolase
MSSEDIASKIDHTFLKANSTTEQIEVLCAEAIENNFASVCIPPYFISKAKVFLEGSKVKLATVIGFPLGYQQSMIKVEEAKRAMEDGADELDVVINLSALFSGNENDVFNEIQSITQLAHLKGKIVKWIIETGLLNEEQIKQCCALAIKAEVDFVKTSTGFNGSGATVEVIELLRKILPFNIKIKASGGIKTREQTVALIYAGADRIGTSSSISIIT